MKHQVDNAVIMAAGMASRFVPVSMEKPKALLRVRGEILIERQIRQLQEAGIDQIVVVTGYLKEQFDYLQERFGVILAVNPEYQSRNNNGSLYAVREYLKNTFICSADNYFTHNPFEKENEESYYAVVYAPGKTDEWCIQSDEEGYIKKVHIGGCDAWYMMGHAFFTEEFSRRFRAILEREYDLPETRNKLWEAVYTEHIHELPMRVKRYQASDIYEFDTLDELRGFDPAWAEHSGSPILKELAERLGCPEGRITEFCPVLKGNRCTGMVFVAENKKYCYDFLKKELRMQDGDHGKGQNQDSKTA